MSANPLLELLCAPWAIQPEKLAEMQAIYAAHLHGERADLEAIEARLGRPLANEQQEYTVRAGGVAVLPIDGVLSPKANLFTRISGGASAQMLQTQVESAIADPRVKSLVLSIDSPGGSVFGSPELAAAVYELSAVKPIVAVSDGLIASAAYWVGSAANAVFLSGPTVHAGSIGVVATHNYVPARDRVQTTEITAGRYKRMATESAPLDAEGRAYLQQRVDHIYQVFVDAVAQHRGTDPQTVLNDMADGRVFVGQQAIDAGLADGFATVDAIAEQLAADPSAYTSRRRVGQRAKPSPRRASAAAALPSSAAKHQPEGANSMPITREQLAADAPDLLTALLAEGSAQGAAGERARIAAVREQSMPGHEALIEQLAMDGKTTGPEAAVAVLAAERKLGADRRAALAADTPPPLAADANAGADDSKPEQPSNPMAEARSLAQAIAQKQAEASAAGRTLTAVEALAQVKLDQA